MLRQVGKRAGYWITVYSIFNEVEAKTAVAHSWRGSPVIESCNSQRIYERINIECTQGAGDGASIKILQFDMHQAWILFSMPSFRLIDNLKGHLLHHRPVIL